MNWAKGVAGTFDNWELPCALSRGVEQKAPTRGPWRPGRFCQVLIAKKDTAVIFTCTKGCEIETARNC